MMGCDLYFTHFFSLLSTLFEGSKGVKKYVFKIISEVNMNDRDFFFLSTFAIFPNFTPMDDDTKCVRGTFFFFILKPTNRICRFVASKNKNVS